MPDLNEYADSITDLRARFEAEMERLREECNSTAPDSMRMRISEEVANSDEIFVMGLNFIVKDQLWELQINRDGQKLPLYKPATIAKKRLLGHSPDKLVNYTNYWTGKFYNYGINIDVDRENNFYDFKILPPYDEFIPADRVGLTQENEEILNYAIQREVDRRLYDWYEQQLNEIEL